ncbi:MAG: anthranilate phosphoribosyltransferase, partial [bacterium]
MPLTPYLHRVVGRQDLSAADAYEAMSVILRGDSSVSLITAFLVALRMKGETASEILG